MERRGIVSAGHCRLGAPCLRKWANLLLALGASMGAVSCAQMSADNTHLQQPSQPAVQSKIVLIPSAIDFSSVVLGQKNSQTVKLTNGDTKRVQVTDISIAGSGLSVTGVTVPLFLDPQGSEAFNIDFAPKSAGPVTGTLTIESSIAAQTFNVKGTGTKAQSKLQTEPASIDFGKLGVNKTTSQKVTISNTGNSRVSITKVALNGTGFKVSELPSQFALEPQQSTSFQVSFHPQAKGVVKGSLSFTSQDLTVPVALSLTGDAVDAGSTPANSAHTVNLKWDVSPGNVAGYNVYRSEESGGPYDKLTSSLSGSASYLDSGVESGQKYYYVVTSVNHGGHESKRSDQVSVTIPNP